MGAPPGAEGEAWSRIVGVVDDVHETALHEVPPEMAYYPVSGAAFVADVPWPMRYVVRAPNAAARAGPVREALRRLDPALPVFGVETFETRVGRARGTRAFVMVLLVVAAGLALLLGAVGLYGVVSYTVAQRRCEIAIRMAVGARAGDVRRLVLAEAGGLALVGAMLGVGAALALTGQLRSLRRSCSRRARSIRLSFLACRCLWFRCVCWRVGCRRGGRRVSSRWWRCGSSRLPIRSSSERARACP